MDTLQKKRFNLVRYLYGLFWCLILLNDFVDKDWAKRVFANRNKNITLIKYYTV